MQHLWTLYDPPAKVLVQLVLTQSLILFSSNVGECKAVPFSCSSNCIKATQLVYINDFYTW